MRVNAPLLVPTLCEKTSGLEFAITLSLTTKSIPPPLATPVVVTSKTPSGADVPTPTLPVPAIVILVLATPLVKKLMSLALSEPNLSGMPLLWMYAVSFKFGTAKAGAVTPKERYLLDQSRVRETPTAACAPCPSALLKAANIVGSDGRSLMMVTG